MAGSSKSSNKAAAALVILMLAILGAAGPAAGATSTRHGCFVGWSPLEIVYSVLCLLLGPNPFPSPKPCPPAGQGLSVGYYSNSGTCPSAEQLVRNAVVEATNKNRAIGAGLIRLHFHDAFVRGCDASVLLNKTATGNNNDTERTAPPNANSLRGFEVIDAAKAAVEAACPGKVSCADILALAARNASNILSYNKINYEVPCGRKDGRESFADETDQLPGPNSNVQQLNASFAAQGLSLADMVTLAGAHSVGDARCLFFTGRLSDMNQTYADQLRVTCSPGPSTRVNQDNRTAEVLDHQYYKNIFDKFVLFASDAALNSSETIAQVTANADDYRTTWYTDFGNAMVRMGNIIDTTPGKEVEIRKECWKINDQY